MINYKLSPMQTYATTNNSYNHLCNYTIKYILLFFFFLIKKVGLKYNKTSGSQRLVVPHFPYHSHKIPNQPHQLILHHRLHPNSITLNVIIAVDPIEHQHQSHRKGTIKPRLHAQWKDIFTQRHVRWSIHFASNLSHGFLRRVEDRAASLREVPLDLVLLSRTLVHIYRHARPSDYRWSTYAEDRFLTLRSLPCKSLPPLM